MVLDALRAYLQLASGVTEESRQRAIAVARSVLAQTPSVDSGATGQLQQQVAALAEDLVVTSRANRELLLGLIRTEVERTLSRLGIASADEVDTLRRSVERLERLVREQRSPTVDAAAAKPAPTEAVHNEDCRRHTVDGDESRFGIQDRGRNRRERHGAATCQAGLAACRTGGVHRSGTPGGSSSAEEVGGRDKDGQDVDV